MERTSWITGASGVVLGWWHGIDGRWMQHGVAGRGDCEGETGVHSGSAGTQQGVDMALSKADEQELDEIAARLVANQQAYAAHYSPNWGATPKVCSWPKDSKLKLTPNAHANLVELGENIGNKNAGELISILLNKILDDDLG